MPVDPNEAPEGYEARESKGTCEGCALRPRVNSLFITEKCRTVRCSHSSRNDKSSVIFVKKESETDMSSFTTFFELPDPNDCMEFSIVREGHTVKLVGRKKLEDFDNLNPGDRFTVDGVDGYWLKTSTVNLTVRVIDGVVWLVNHGLKVRRI